MRSTPQSHVSRRLSCDLRVPSDRATWESPLILFRMPRSWAGDFKVGDDKSARNWTQVHSRACFTASLNWNWCAENNISVVLGEWSLATNHDAPLELSDPRTALELRRMFKEQLSVYTDPVSAPLVGHFFWTLRMGSGWDPRPSAAHPHGRQVGGSSSSRSLKGYPFRVWSLLELARYGIATPLDEPDSRACTAVAQPV